MPTTRTETTTEPVLLQAGLVLRYPTQEIVPFVHADVGAVRLGGPVHEPYTWGPALTAAAVSITTRLCLAGISACVWSKPIMNIPCGFWAAGTVSDGWAGQSGCGSSECRVAMACGQHHSAAAGDL